MNKTLINSSEFTKIIQTKFGKIQGFKYKLSNEKWADIFLGIPFAKPPIGELRFENPQPPDTWEGILNCSEFGLSSISVDLKSFKTSKYSEDCLTLNIFCPSEISSSSSPLPVLFYIHGGGFCTGSAVDYGFKHWVENFIPQEIILVTIQYRLGPLGFLSLGEFMPGNFGLWDMALALKFVYENIENFGGNCHKITVGGLSAGGAASASLALSPITKDMVYATIEMSGTVLAEWTASEQVVTSGREFAKRALMLGEENNDSTDLISLLESTDEPLDLTSIERIKQKLKLLSVETIIKITTEMGTTRYEPNLLVWTPRIDGIFFPNDFLYLIKNKFDDKPIPSLMGVTGKEGIYFAIQGKDKFLNPFGIPREKMENFGEKEFCEFVKHSLLLSVPFKKFCQTSRKFYKEMPEYMLTEICNFYLKKKEEEKNGIKIEKETKNATFYLEQYVRLISDLLFNVPFIWMAKIRRAKLHPTYLYINNYFNSEQFPEWLPIKGATHANEYPYINGLFPVGEFTFNEQDKQHSQTLIQIISNFVKHGEPKIKEWSSNSTGNDPDFIPPLKIMEMGIVDGEHKLFRKEHILYGEKESLRDFENSAYFWTKFCYDFRFDPVKGKEKDKFTRRFHYNYY